MSGKEGLVGSSPRRRAFLRRACRRGNHLDRRAPARRVNYMREVSTARMPSLGRDVDSRRSRIVEVRAQGVTDPQHRRRQIDVLPAETRPHPNESVHDRGGHDGDPRTAPENPIERRREGRSGAYPGLGLAHALFGLSLVHIAQPPGHCRIPPRLKLSEARVCARRALVSRVEAQTALAGATASLPGKADGPDQRAGGVQRDHRIDQVVPQVV